MTDVSQNSDELAKLRERLALLEEQNKVLLRGTPVYPPHWRLTAGESRLLATLQATGYADIETLLKAASTTGNATRPLVKTLIHTLRKKLSEAGLSVEIVNQRGEGYSLLGEIPGSAK